ncbi:hypothetical protein D3C84_257610 [compost metagenome]
MQVADHLGSRVAGNGDGHGAVAADREGLRFVRNDNRRLQGKAAGVDDLAVGVQVEGAVTGVGRGAVRLQDLEETATVDGHVQRLLGGLQAAGGEVFLGADDAHTGTQLQTRRQFAVLGRLGAWLALDLVEQVLELGAVTFETRGRHVGQVVGNGGQVGVLGGQTCFGNP